MSYAKYDRQFGAANHLPNFSSNDAFVRSCGFDNFTPIFDTASELNCLTSTVIQTPVAKNCGTLCDYDYATNTFPSTLGGQPLCSDLFTNDQRRTRKLSNLTIGFNRRAACLCQGSVADNFVYTDRGGQVAYNADHGFEHLSYEGYAAGNICSGFGTQSSQISDAMTGGFDNYIALPYLDVTLDDVLLGIGGSSNGGADVNTDARLRCRLPGCNKVFGRLSDLERHWQSVHLGLRHHCHVRGCPNNKGKGYSRLDKLKDHLRKGHMEGTQYLA
ncbi:uncharacterized protein PAC_15062 [Phialocephala subalpina]|uniref:C2H2-type domain-containing protein n=1 Tax=Phialocephala subalpina TaxID=576137 RepID=A0A1L7XJD9_9HELO|nr:uncharacterized protein PAC_15062 [Phialocephala subalpina]